MCFKFEDVTYVHAPKIGSRTILGWFAILGEPSLKDEHPEFFKEVSVGDALYKGIRSRVKATEKIETPIAFCITRDPVVRFVSNFKNRVLTHEKVKPVPSIEEFIENFDVLYEENIDVNNHFKSLTEFYGTDRSIFSQIYRTERLGDCKAFLEQHFNTTLPDLKLQQSKPTASLTLTPDQEAWVKEKYAVDYENGWV